MPAQSFYQVIESILNGKLEYDYYDYNTSTYSTSNKTRICHIKTDCNYDDSVAVAMIFTIRNQPNPSNPSVPIWKIHSEGPKRMDPGATVPLRNAAVKLAKTNNWKYFALASVSEDAPQNELISKYIVSIESYEYGDETVCPLTDQLNELAELGEPDIYRTMIHLSGNKYYLTFVKRDKLINYLICFDNRPYAKDTLCSNQIVVENIPENLSASELGEILMKMYNEAEHKTTGIHMFGLKYGDRIIKNGITPNAIIKTTSLASSQYDAEITKGINIYRSILKNEFGIKFYEPVESNVQNAGSCEECNYVFNNRDGQNLVVYGTPGCGKSYYVQHTLLMKGGYRFDDNGTTCLDAIRTTFYQDYTNTDFVGQIMPIVKVDGSVTYEFNPGPFTLALNKAIQNPDRPIALVIEELNRGNAASIFGDIFQLLDRENGTSVYNITNVNVQKYLSDQNPDKKFDYIKLPSNLSIFATMNTSDQNVFTLDTAFKRRWKFEKIKNSFSSDHPFKDSFVPGMAIDWEEFCDAINEFILTSDSFINSEDKQLGVYFVDEKGLRKDIADASTEKSRKEFAYKVFEYLWDDVAKYNRADWFGNIKSLDELIDTYVEKGNGDTNGKEVFTNKIFK